MELTDEDRKKIIEILNQSTLHACDADWYIDHILERIWDEIPVETKRPTVVLEIREMIVDKITEIKDKIKDELKKQLGLTKDENDEEVIEYILNFDITDDVSGTVLSVLGGGPTYRGVVEELERAAGSVMFYEHRDRMPNGKTNFFNLKIEIFKNDELVMRTTSPLTDNIDADTVFEVLRGFRYDMARIRMQEEDQKKEGENNESQ